MATYSPYITTSASKMKWPSFAEAQVSPHDRKKGIVVEVYKAQISFT